MPILVQKFGGTSLSTAEARALVIEHIQDALQQLFQVVVVVSAMGRKGEPYATDTLLELVRSNGNRLPDREKDMLLACGEIISAATMCSLLQAAGISAVALTGGQAGIVTNAVFGDARIVSIDTSRIKKLLNEGHVVIVTGFQGKTADDDFTTLGRGGSDTSATALGAALKAEYVDIFTDVNGILTADPRIVEDAKPLEQVSYTEICNMAHNGAKVIHPRAVEVAMQAGIPIRVRSTFSKDTGTLVASSDVLRGDAKQVHDKFVTGIAHFPHVTQVQVTRSDHTHYDMSLQVFKAMAQHRISVDLINVTPSGVAYTVFDHVADKAEEIIRSLGFEPKLLRGCAKVSVIGGGMSGVPGIMAYIVEALAKEDIPILQSADSNATIWVLVPGDHMADAVRALHKTFELHK
ncbi:aspartate kinase [Paenibacillus chartarius]|uniref:Aspartokinase n=1 Tax=Paenibacillus chartarius TaxID=747481 RepID=A0ABV6DT23_9BACL